MKPSDNSAANGIKGSPFEGDSPFFDFESKRLDDVADDAETNPLLKFRGDDVLEVGQSALRVEVWRTVWLFHEALHGEFVVNLHHDDITRPRAAAAVNDEKVTVADPGFRHGLAAGADREGRGMRAFQHFVEVNRFFSVPLRR